MDIYRERLLILARHLRNVPEETFNIGSWYFNNKYGYAACAIGHATLIPEFQKQGLNLEQERMVPYYQGCQNWKAVDCFFGLEREESEYLFAPWYYCHSENVAPFKVADRIEKFVTEKYRLVLEDEMPLVETVTLGTLGDLYEQCLS